MSKMSEEEVPNSGDGTKRRLLSVCRSLPHCAACAERKGKQNRETEKVAQVCVCVCLGEECRILEQHTEGENGEESREPP